MNFDYQKFLLIAVITILLLGVLYGMAAVTRAVLRWRQLLRRKSVTLLLTPPASLNTSAHATQEFFNVIHGFRASRNLKHKLLRREVSLSLEVDSTKDQGIRYLAKLAPELVPSFHQAVTAYLPQLKMTEIKDDKLEATQISEITQLGHYAFPLAQTKSLEQHDPASYLVNMLTNLESNECVRLQLVITPVRINEAAMLARKVLGNEDLLSHLASKKLSGWSAFANLLSKSLLATTDTIGEMYHGSTKSYYSSDKQRYEKLQIAKRQRPARTLSAFELELMDTIHTKLTQPLFRVSFRVAVSIDDEAKVRERFGAIKTALQSYTVPSYQGFKTCYNWPVIRQLRKFAYEHRLPALFARRESVLASSELASLYHFPLGTNTQTDNLITSLSRTLPAPVSLKQSKGLDIVLGINKHHGVETKIGLTAAERERHIYIIGGTGNGKTTMLQYGIVNDLQSGKGVAVLDPHGDLAETLLSYVPEERIKDVIYINPDDFQHPVGINLLELPDGLTDEALLREKDLVTESTISVLRKIFSEDDSGGHRIEYILRNTIQTALTIPGATLFTIFRLLNDTKFRRQIVKGLEDQDLKNFWINELGKAGEMQKVKMSAGITAKIGRFLFSASARRILEQEKSTIDFDEVLGSGKILICNFSKGLLGEDTSTLFGTTILAKIQMAALRRARQNQADRQPFYLYVDEFQNFATMSFVQMLSEARKYKLFLAMAEQSTQQQADRRLVDIILANVGTVVCFRSGSPADERLILPLFQPYIEQGEIANLPAYSFYCRISSVLSQEPLSGTTLLLEEKGDELMRQKAIEFSQTHYATQASVSKPKPEKADKVRSPKQKAIKKTASAQEAIV